MLPEISEDLQEYRQRQERTDRISAEYCDTVEFSSRKRCNGVMGVPITYLLKHCPEQFEIVGATESEGKGFSDGLWEDQSGVAQAILKGEKVYKRLFIKRKNYR